MWLAVDGGATGLRMTIVNSDGTVGGQVRAPGFQWTAQGDPVQQQCDRVVHAWRELGEPAPVSAVGLGLAGAASDPQSRRRLAPLIARALNAGTVLLTGDDVTNHLGVLGGEPGVVIAAGTGVACLAVTPGGELLNIDGMGYLFGDRGGGFAIGQAGLRAALEAVEGVGADTALIERAAAVLRAQIETLPRAIRTWYASERLIARTAEFAIHVTEVAAYDEVARRICQRAGRELAASAAAAARRAFGGSGAGNDPDGGDDTGKDTDAGGPGGKVPVSYSGSVLSDRTVFDAFAAALPDQVTLTEPMGDAMSGAIRLARQPAVPHLSGVIVHRQ